MSSRDIKFKLSFSTAKPVYVDAEEVNNILGNAPNAPTDTFLDTVVLNNTDLEFTLNDGSQIIFDAGPFLADIFAQSGVYDSLTESLIFTLSNGQTFSVPVAALLPVQTDSTIDGDGNTVPLSAVELTGADGVTDGEKGIAPTPLALDNVKFLKGDGTWSLVTKDDVGLGNVDNTSDLDKPISTATQAALDLKADEADLQQEITDRTNADANLQSQITSNDADILAIQNEQITQNTNITNNTNLINAETTNRVNADNNLQTQITSNDTDITNLQAEQVTQNSAIAANTAKVSADGSIDTHNDVDTTTTTPNNNDVLTWDGSNWVPQSAQDTDDQTAAEVPFTPTGNTTSNNVQDAIEELQTDIDGLSLDHGDLSGLLDDDHPQYLNEARHDSLPFDNPHNVNATQVGLGNVDNTSDLDKPISTATQTALDLKADEADLLQEITDRGNADTLLQSQIDSNDTDITNIQADQATQDAAIALNTAKVSADGSVDTHSDVDTSTNAPVNGDFLGFDGTNWVPQTLDNGYTIFPIWAEESGGLSNNNRQWSFGNGATGNINIVLPIDAELFAVSFDAEIGSPGTVSMDIMKDDALLLTTKAFTTKDFELLASPQSFTAGECVGFRTDVETGALTDARVCAWFRIPSSIASTSLLNDLLDVSITSVTNGDVLTWNGSNWVNQAVPSAPVTSVNGDTGAVVITASDLGAVESVNGNLPNALGDVGLNTDDIPEGISNEYYTDAKVTANPSVTANTAKVSADGSVTTHSDVTNAGSGQIITGAERTLLNSALQSGDNVSELVNDAGYITAGDVAANETTTSISLNTNILTYTDEDGVDTDIDLSIYLDDTNLARIVSGSIDPISNIATFTRDDATTFTVDFSSLNDQTAINTAISNHEAAADPHPQYETSAEAQAKVDAHANLTNNPHSVTATQVGLGNVDNTSDLNKPISTATQAALDLKADLTDLNLDAIKLINTAATGNLNSGVATLGNYSTTDQLGISSASFTAAATGITCNFTGFIRINFNIELSGFATRACVGFRWHNDTQGTNGPWTRHTYIRNASGHTETSANFTTLLAVTSGDVIQIQRDNFAGGGTVVSPANGIEFMIERLQ